MQISLTLESPMRAVVILYEFRKQFQCMYFPLDSFDTFHLRGRESWMLIRHHETT